MADRRGTDWKPAARNGASLEGTGIAAPGGVKHAMKGMKGQTQSREHALRRRTPLSVWEGGGSTEDGSARRAFLTGVGACQYAASLVDRRHFEPSDRYLRAAPESGYISGKPRNVARVGRTTGWAERA
jgi:hypothetical protein